jgi:hypothetical protein
MPSKHPVAAAPGPLQLAKCSKLTASCSSSSSRTTRRRRRVRARRRRKWKKGSGAKTMQSSESSKAGVCGGPHTAVRIHGFQG